MPLLCTLVNYIDDENVIAVVFVVVVVVFYVVAVVFVSVVISNANDIGECSGTGGSIAHPSPSHGGVGSEPLLGRSVTADLFSADAVRITIGPLSLSLILALCIRCRCLLLDLLPRR